MKWWVQDRDGSPGGSALPAVAAFFLAAGLFSLPAVAEPSAAALLQWQGKDPYVQITVRPDPDAKALDTAEGLRVPVSVFNNDNRKLWSGVVDLAVDADKAWSGKTQVKGVRDPKAQYRLEAELRDPGLGLNYRETIRFGDPAGPVVARSIRRLGAFPDQRLWLALQINAVQDRAVTDLELDLALRDAQDNVVIKKLEALPVGHRISEHRVEVTPDLRTVGPYSLECTLANDLVRLSYTWTERFAFANALLPLSSMESDARDGWFTSTFGDPGKVNTYRIPFGPDIMTDTPTWDAVSKVSGSRALRIDYVAGQPGRVFSNIVLPGLPMRARIRVKGNNSGDTLVAFWRDRCEFVRWAHERFINHSQAVVCTLDFDGWREFDVPVLGEGLQLLSRHEDLKGVAVPIYMFAFSVEPKELAKGETHGNEPRSIVIDDLRIETQLSAGRRMSLELRGDTLGCELHAKAELILTVGNGGVDAIAGASVRVVARDRLGETVTELQEALDVPAQGFATKSISLAAVAALDPLGPVDLDVSVFDPATGRSVADRLTYKNAKSQALMWDFERPEIYNGLRSDDQVVAVAGGADGSAMALQLNIATGKTSSVLLHPMLPGITAGIGVQIKGGAAPVMLQPLWLDSGLTGVAGMPYNVIQAPPIRVDWQGWRTVEIECPAIPAHYDDEERSFLLRPYHPLNLAFVASAAADKPAEVRLDNIRLTTHLLPTERIRAAVDFPDDTRIHSPGAPLKLILANFEASRRDVALRAVLRDSLGAAVVEREIQVVLDPGARTEVVVAPVLQPGIHFLEVVGPHGLGIHEVVTVLDAKRHFGDDPRAMLLDVARLEQAMGITKREVHLDWDNMELVPGYFHYTWFHNEVAKAAEDGKYSVIPVVGFSADWAGPEKRASIAKGEYTRYIGNYLQTPARMVDWSLFVREAAREYKGMFAAWAFWENPDIPEFPAYIPPAKYPEMLAIFHRWVSLYDPDAKVVASGFNFDRALAYLDAIPDVAKLPFDRIALQMNIGELAPEQADLEGFLDELNQLLHLRESGRQAEVTQLDWSIGEHVSPAMHAAYHARAALILDALGAAPHRFPLLNMGESFDGYGVAHRVPYGNTSNVQVNRPVCVPKPAYFALVRVREFLRDWTFVKRIRLPGGDPYANRAYVYRDAAGAAAAVIWRAGPGAREYAVPSSWNDFRVEDAFGFERPAPKTLACRAMPSFVFLPPGYALAQLTHELRMLAPADGPALVTLDLHVTEPDSAQRATYSATGTITRRPHLGRLPGAVPVNETFAHGVETEKFSFVLPEAGDALLTRLWFSDGTNGAHVALTLNDGPGQAWDLQFSEDEELRAFYRAGIRQSSFVLRRCTAGANTVALRYAEPGAVAGYRVEPLTTNAVDLARWGALAVVQGVGELQKRKSAVGTPLKIGKTVYDNGLGAHAPAFMDFPLGGQFSTFEVTVGVDAATDGKGSVVFKVLVDGVEKANSGIMTGFAKAKDLKVDGLETAQRLILLVEDAGDGHQDDLADWVNGKLFLKK